MTMENKAKLAILYAGAVWGLFWIPLRRLEGEGIDPLWVTSIYFMVPAAIIFPVLMFRWRSIASGGLSLQLTVLVSGAALSLYSASIVFTDVIRAIMLFYLMPIWSTLLARVFLGEAITPIRILAMILAALGMLTLFGLGVGLPIPRNVGDWMGLGAGVFWAIAMVRIRLNGQHNAIDLTTGFFFWGLALTLAISLLFAHDHVPSWDQVKPALPLLVVFVAILVIPGTFASLWGPKFISPGISGLLFMTEIVVGAISAALLAGEPFGQRELVGVALIASASLIEPIMSLRKGRDALK